MDSVYPTRRLWVSSRSRNIRQPLSDQIRISGRLTMRRTFLVTFRVRRLRIINYRFRIYHRPKGVIGISHSISCRQVNPQYVSIMFIRASRVVLSLSVLLIRARKEASYHSVCHQTIRSRVPISNENQNNPNCHRFPLRNSHRFNRLIQGRQICRLR